MRRATRSGSQEGNSRCSEGGDRKVFIALLGSNHGVHTGLLLTPPLAAAFVATAPGAEGLPCNTCTARWSHLPLGFGPSNPLLALLQLRLENGHGDCRQGPHVYVSGARRCSSVGLAGGGGFWYFWSICSHCHSLFRQQHPLHSQLAPG